MADERQRGLSVRLNAWRQLWYRGPNPQVLRAKYRHDKQAYYASFRLDEQDAIDMQEQGMQYFAKLEARLTRALDRAAYWRRGRTAISSLLSTISTGIMTDDADFIFVCIDLEGGLDRWGIKESGVAKMDTRDLLASCSGGPIAQPIKTENYALGKHRNRRFMFGATTRLSSDILKDHIQGSLSINDTDSVDRRRIVLTGQGLSSELKTFELLGIHLSDLPQVVGFADTQILCNEVLGRRGGSLGNILNTLELPCRKHTLHCAGNDAYYTLTCLLALLNLLDGTEASSHLSDMARQPLPERNPSWDKTEVNNWDEAEVLEDITSLFDATSVEGLNNPIACT